MAEHGAGEILLTSMDRDGTKAGFDIGLTRAISDAVPVPVIALSRPRYAFDHGAFAVVFVYVWLFGSDLP